MLVVVEGDGDPEIDLLCSLQARRGWIAGVADFAGRLDAVRLAAQAVEAQSSPRSVKRLCRAVAELAAFSDEQLKEAEREVRRMCAVLLGPVAGKA